MLGNDRIETASTKVTSIRRRNDKEKSTWRTQQYFVDFESRIHVEISTSNRCHNFHVDLPFKIDEISTNFSRGIWTSNPWWIDEDVFIGKKPVAWNGSNKYPYPSDVEIRCSDFLHLKSGQTTAKSLTKINHWEYIDSNNNVTSVSIKQ